MDGVVFGPPMILRFVEPVENLGSLGKRRKLMTEKTNQFEQPFQADPRVAEE
jgi:hypothetical protein